ncbi:MAG: hypothetical protein Q4D96_09930 [Propionibacteriaceae bacterium]|nr:hypothetical protein [Propionibacteriaceae bacterium]
MSEPYPSGQQPGYQPSPGYQPQQQGGMSPNPYSPQQGGYSPQNDAYAQQAYGQPGGYPPPGYGQPGGYAPQGYGQPARQRPGSATGASVLGIISGSFGIIVGFFAVLVVTGADIVTGSSQGLWLTLGYINAFGTFLTAVALLASGITFLKGKGYGVLLGAGIAQAACVTLGLVMNLMQGADLNGAVILILIIGYGLAGTTIFLMLSPSARQWKK